MVSFHIESWSAIAPSLESAADWRRWLEQPRPLNTVDKLSLKQVPPLLRRRLNVLGKHVVAVSMDVLTAEQQMPTVFASRHGDTQLTLGLLRNLGCDTALSPTQFSLSVHNAVTGLLSIARRDTQPTTAIAAMHGLMLQTLCEGVSMLQQYEKVLCVVSDIPLPEIYQSYCEGQNFPYALAFVMQREGTKSWTLNQTPSNSSASVVIDEQQDDVFEFMRLLCGEKSQITLPVNQSDWHITVLDDVG